MLSQQMCHWPAAAGEAWGIIDAHSHVMRGVRVLGNLAVTCVVYRVLPIKATTFIYTDSMCNDPTAQCMLEDLERII